MSKPISFQVAIVGAGPYGLAAAAHLREAGIEYCSFGEAMEFWQKQMPNGMLLRSVWSASHISDPRRAYSLDRYCDAEGIRLPQPMTLEQFVAYGRWFQRQTAPELDSRRVVEIQRRGNRFLLRLNDEEVVAAQRVVLAAGISPFARRAPEFDGFSAELVSHTSEHRTLHQFAGRRIAVIGGGQSALEAAAILHDAGASVEVIVRHSKINWLDQKATWLKSKSNPIRQLLYPPTDVGPPGLNLIVAAPDLFRRLPRYLQETIAYRSIRPAGSGWLVPRLRHVPISTSRFVRTASPHGNQVQLNLNDNTTRTVDHVLLATGYRVDISRYGFLSADLIRELRLVEGYPQLSAGLESSVPGLHFIGAPAARSFGPLCRFVSGTTFAATALTQHIRNSRLAPPEAVAAKREELATA